MGTLLWIILSTSVISLLSLAGIATLGLGNKMLPKIIFLLVSLSVGVLLGGAFLHLIPEASETINIDHLYLYVLFGFLLFFFVEKILMWRHCHKGHCAVHTFSIMSLVGDSIHNFIDGVVIAASFSSSTHLGISTTVAVATHEIPQEIGDFGVLVHGGFSHFRALLCNFLTALTAIAGGIVGYFVPAAVGLHTDTILLFAAGGFLYIAASDLIPELRKEVDMKRSLIVLLTIVAGIFLTYAMKSFGV